MSCVAAGFARYSENFMGRREYIFLLPIFLSPQFRVEGLDEILWHIARVRRARKISTRPKGGKGELK